MGKFDHVIGKEVGSGTLSWDADRTMLYAVGVGAGLDDPLKELQFTTENTPGIPQRVLPSFLSLLGVDSGWAKLFYGQEGRYPVGMVHGEQGVTLARLIPPAGTAHVSVILRGVYDKGSGALAVTETRVTLDNGEYLGTSRMALFAQGAGGFGGPRRPDDEQDWAQPERAPDLTVSLPTGVNQSLIYRLLGDHNPHGWWPPRAEADGFPRPIFYGLGTFGVTCRALLRGLCEEDVTRFGAMHARNSKPVHPGDRLDTRIWRTETGAQFQVLANGERVVLDRGVFSYAS